MRITVESNHSEVSQKFDGLADRVRNKLRQTMRSLAIQAQGVVKDDKLSGQVLHARTSNLRNSIYQRVEESGDSIVGVIGTVVKYGRVHEYGFDDVVSVRAHIRRSRAQMAQATYTRTNKKGEKITKVHQKGRYGKSTGEINVRSFERHMNIPERSFLRSTLRDMSGTIHEQLQASILKALSHAKF